MLSTLFDTQTSKSGQQQNFLKVMANIPDIKRAMSDKPNEHNTAIAQEAT